MKKAWIIISILIVILVIGTIFVLTQTQPTITKTVQVVLSLTPSVDFSLAVDPIELTSPVGRVVGFIASVTSVNDFAGEVIFSVSDVPESVTVTILPSDTITLGASETKGVQINFGVPLDNGLVGMHTISITATSTVYN